VAQPFWVVHRRDAFARSRPIEYRIDCGDWTTYSGEIRIRPNDVVEARATDQAGNISPVLTVRRTGNS